MKRAVYISFEGDLPEDVDMATAIAEILEHHASDIRDNKHIASQNRSGTYKVSGINIDPHWTISWRAEPKLPAPFARAS